MLVIILMLIVGIILRWDFVRKELSGAFNWFDRDTKTETVTPAE